MLVGQGRRSVAEAYIHGLDAHAVEEHIVSEVELTREDVSLAREHLAHLPRGTKGWYSAKRSR
mgnify:CR=1 FL=1